MPASPACTGALPASSQPATEVAAESIASQVEGGQLLQASPVGKGAIEF